MQEYKNGMKREREYLHVTLSLEHWASGDELRASHRSQVQSGVLSKHWWPPVCVWLTSYTLAHTDTPWHTLWHTLEHWQTLAHTHAHPGVLTHPGTHCCLYTTTKIPRTFITYNSYYGIYHPKKRKAKWRVIFSFLFSLSLLCSCKRYEWLVAFLALSLSASCCAVQRQTHTAGPHKLGGSQ